MLTDQSKLVPLLFPSGTISDAELSLTAQTPSSAHLEAPDLALQTPRETTGHCCDRVELDEAILAQSFSSGERLLDPHEGGR